ncbi:MAG: nucleotide exchange factor GrpE, partial [bacterium]
MTNNDQHQEQEQEKEHQPILPKSDDLVLDEKLSELEITRQSLEEKQKKLQEYHDQILRLRADFDNYRKRMEKEKAEFIKYSNEGLLIKFMALFDDIERAKKAIDDTDNLKTLTSGVNLIYKNFSNFFKQEGVKEIKSVGEILDPNKHHAVMQIESEKHKDDEIVEELQKGYTLNDRVIRPAMVKVSKRKPKEEKKKEEK